MKAFLKRMQRLISLLLVLLMAVSCIHISAVSAAESGAVEPVEAHLSQEEPVTRLPSLEDLPEAEEVSYDEVPLYFQTDYPDDMYGSGTIANNGCSVTCLAMVATYLTDHKYLPDELARYFGGAAENNIARLEKGAEAMQLPWQKMENFHKAMEALREGKVVIALMQSGSIFTTSQHFIVLTGFNENGLIMVNDPYEPNYEKWDLKRAMQEGFTEDDICCGFSGAWAFDKSAMPEVRCPLCAAARRTPEAYAKIVRSYFQTDYPNTMYGSGTVASSGCGITSLAMVATYLTGHEYLPDELARYFGGTAENNIARLEKGAEAMRLPWKKLTNFHKALEALHDGQIVIALMESGSPLTSSQHFVVLTGINKKGLIMVNDPYAPNYEKWDLKQSFQEGFTEADICKGFSGAWAFDKSAMPEEPFLYYEEDLRGEPRYPDIQLTYEEIQLLARVVWVEARGESAEGQQAVAEVVLNRMASPNFGNTLHGVIYGEGQFRSVPFLEDAEPYQAQYEAIERAIYGPYVLPEDVMHFATFRVNNNVWGQIGGHIFCREE